eukprot:m51a1_g850 hypothetical protein (594) ;mRNA; r:785654-787706
MSPVALTLSQAGTCAEPPIRISGPTPPLGPSIELCFRAPLPVVRVEAWEGARVLGWAAIDVVGLGLTDQKPREARLVLSRTPESQPHASYLSLRLRFKYRPHMEAVYKAFREAAAGAFKSSLRCAATALALFPMEPRLLALRAECNFKSGNTDDALEDAEVVLQFAVPNRRGLFLWQGWALLERCDVASARVALARALEKSPEDAAAFEQRLSVTNCLAAAKSLYDRDMVAQCTEALTELVCAHPAVASTHYCRFLCHMRSLDLGAAADDALAVAIRSPDWVVTGVSKEGCLELLRGELFESKWAVLKRGFLLLSPRRGACPDAAIALHKQATRCVRTGMQTIEVSSTGQQQQLRCCAPDEATAWADAIISASLLPAALQFPTVDHLQCELGEMLKQRTPLPMLPAVRPATALRTGFMWKKSQGSARWSLRFFVLESSSLFYCDVGQLPRALQADPRLADELQPCGAVDLGPSTTLGAYSGDERPLCLELRSPHRTLAVGADTQDDLDGWKCALLNIVTPYPSPSPENSPDLQPPRPLAPAQLLSRSPLGREPRDPLQLSLLETPREARGRHRRQDTLFADNSSVCSCCCALL